MPTKIEWVKNPDGTQGELWNPVTGCTPVTEGCRNCYAKEFHKRFNKEPFDKIVCHPERLSKPLGGSIIGYLHTNKHLRKKAKMFFVNSMSDLFHKDVPFEFIDKVMTVISICQHHTFAILTKRPDRMNEYFKTIIENKNQEAMRLMEIVKWLGCLPENIKKLRMGQPLPNLWLGVSVSNQPDADKFIPLLLQTPAAKRFVSIEPMLGEISLRWLKINPRPEITNEYDGLRHLDWVICGGESGANARDIPCPRTLSECHARGLYPKCDKEMYGCSSYLDPIRNLRDQCINANVPFFLKQLMIDGKLVHMPELDGQVWEQTPERNV